MSITQRARAGVATALIAVGLLTLAVPGCAPSDATSTDQGVASAVPAR